MNTPSSSFQKTAQRSAAVYLEPRCTTLSAIESGVPNRPLRATARAFGMTGQLIGIQKHGGSEAMNTPSSSFQKMAQHSAAVYLEPRCATFSDTESGVPNRPLRAAAHAFGMTRDTNGHEA